MILVATLAKAWISSSHHHTLATVATIPLKNFCPLVHRWLAAVIIYLAQLTLPY